MTRRFARATVVAAAVALGIAAVRAAEIVPVLPDDPPGATCYHFVLITVCCDGGGCYIKR